MGKPWPAWLLALALLALPPPGLAAREGRVPLHREARGEAVRRVQEILCLSGFYSGPLDGIFGPQTEQAVRLFQKKKGLAVDGVVGARTLSLLVREARWKGGRFLPSARGRARIRVELIPWPEAEALAPDGALLRLLDLQTGLYLVARRRGGHYHMDLEPASLVDTAVLRLIYGGKWSWERRPVAVELRGRYLAGSINGFPHGEDVLEGNDFPGHFCLHFWGSRLHRTGAPDPEHQRMVRRAAEWKG
ncbi:MAG: peptidoglycan-binding domain-containing protein [Bacillota bacterium]|nr:peptidoglycan-binding domain-containing protein [Bacillota bacterium]